MRTHKDGLRYRPDVNATWSDDSMCLTAADAREVVDSYRAAYSNKRFLWLMRQAYADTPFTDCADVFRLFIDDDGKETT